MGEKTVLPPTFAEIDLNYYMTLVRDDSPAALEGLNYASSKSFSPDRKIILLLKSDSIGSGMDELGKSLLLEFITSMYRAKSKPGVIILLNSAVLLAEKGTAANYLASMEKQLFIRIMVCISSADRYGIANDISVGYLASMDEIYNSLMNADKIITL